MVHSARPVVISASSLARSGLHGTACARYVSGKRKKDVLQRSLRQCCLHPQLTQSANPPHPAAGKKKEAITDALSIDKLVNGENQGAPPGSLVAEQLNDLATLPKIKTVEGFIHQQHVLRCQKAERQKQPPIVTLGQRAHTFSQHRS